MIVAGDFNAKSTAWEGQVTDVRGRRLLEICDKTNLVVLQGLVLDITRKMSQLVTVNNFIDGKFVTTKEYLDSFDPSIGQVWARVSNSSADEIDTAVQAAEKAFPQWSVTPVEQRSKLMLKIADLIEARLDEFAEVESHDQGKPVSLAKRIDIPRLIHNFRYFATYCLHDLNSSTVQLEASATNYTVKCPVGVAGLISPWNLPLYLLSFKIAPAIACGNTVVAKPSEMTSVSTQLLCQVFQEAGVPKGVINIVYGYGWTAGKALVEHPRVPLISFTGGTATGEVIRKSAAHLNKRFSLELGGKNPAIIFDDCSFEKCVETTIRSSFVNQGEVCLCTSRIFVQRGIYEKFLEAFVAKAKALVVGDPKDPNTFFGALISKQHREKVVGYIEGARSGGATIRCGHGVEHLSLPDRCQNGYFVQPTVISDLPDSAPAMTDEIFGPVTCVVPFDDEAEVIQRANSVRYGLCATLWTENVSRVHRMSPKLESATIWVNCWLVRDLNMPFGGMKDSGTGKEGGKYSTEFFTQEKTILIQLYLVAKRNVKIRNVLKDNEKMFFKANNLVNFLV
ncbi:2-aminomuconic semialdehyde dehydrogenase [Biomphalaria pfeifferi]|uniref:2-aminomuconic semialdehyde dehydrogenase n=1 Tax=Biomphalaria pfeifferi TaxID=112525 RepID=A0AAD8BU40_BIOPF|nr:2-aminomuconic semialdehyde dehydrogenase [Biomphalaria pfeifferi]